MLKIYYLQYPLSISVSVWCSISDFELFLKIIQKDILSIIFSDQK